MIKWLYIVVLILICCTPVHAQEKNTRIVVVVEDLIEKIARDSEDELDYTTLFNDLVYYFDHPLDLNTASAEELERLHMLTDFQILSLLDYIEQNGALFSLYELQLVYGYSRTLVLRIEPFVTVIPPESRDLQTGIQQKKSSHQLFIRTSQIVQQREGYESVPDSVLANNPNAKYPGNPMKVYTRYLYQYSDKIRAGFTAEKDAGEEFFKGSNTHGFDFYSGYIQLRDTWKIKDLFVGDYKVNLGQGVTIWSDLAFGKNPEVLHIQRKGQGLSRYTSANENEFFRGAATSIELNRFLLTLFASSKKIDANITDTLIDQSLQFSSFQTSGIHALPREVEDEDIIRENIFGGNISYHFKNARLGVTLVHYNYDGYFEQSTEPENLYDFYGNSNSNAGFDYSLRFRKISLFGETGMSSNKGIATLNGAIFELNPTIRFSALYRLYQKNYHALYANAFSENSKTINERGLYIGMEVNPIPYWNFTAYIDAFSFPWLKYNTSSPASGFDYHLQADYYSERDINLYFRFDNLHEPENAIDDVTGKYITVYKNLSRFRAHISYPVSDHIIFQDRLELSFYKKWISPQQKGYMVYHDILYRPETIPLSFTVRMAIFDTDDWESRIYAYEHDVLYAFQIPSFSGSGFRAYLNTRYVINKYVDMWFKISNSYYPKNETIGTGLNEIQGKNKTELRVQVRLKF